MYTNTHTPLEVVVTHLQWPLWSESTQEGDAALPSLDETKDFCSEVGKWEEGEGNLIRIWMWWFFWGLSCFCVLKWPNTEKVRWKYDSIETRCLVYLLHNLSLKVRKNPVSKFADLLYTIHGYAIFGANRLGRTGSLKRFKAGRASKVNSLNLGSLAVKFFCQKYWNISKCDKLKHFPAGHHFIFLCKKPTELILGSLHFEIFCGIYYGDVNPQTKQSRERSGQSHWSRQDSNCKPLTPPCWKMSM